MTTDVRLDRLAAPQWRALPEKTRADIEARIPDDCHLSVLSARFRGHDYHARVFRGTELVAESLICSYVEVACWQALRRAREAMDQAPGEDWEEDEEGYVKAPLSYENREGDPAFNGAFNAW